MKNNIEEIIVALPTSPSPIERWKKLSLDFLFSKNNLNNFQNSKLLLFIENQMSMYNICDLSSSNTAFIKLLQNLDLEIPKRTAIITKFNLKFSLTKEAVPTVIDSLL